MTKSADAGILREAFVEGRGVRVLSVRQPWAWAIFHAGKDVENRSQPTNLRGRLAIHCSARVPTDDELAWLKSEFRVKVPKILPTGVILGTVELHDCRDDAPSRWAEDGQWNWIIREPKLLKNPIPASGKVGFWYWPLGKK